MPTNANTFNSRVTSEALEAKFRQVFPSQGGAELPQDLFASGVITPVVDFSSVAEGSILPEKLQTAWDFATGRTLVASVTPVSIISNTGFWQIRVIGGMPVDGPSIAQWFIDIFDGTTAKSVWSYSRPANATQARAIPIDEFVVFLRSGDTLRGQCASASFPLDVQYRQIADVNGTLVNPLGFTFS